MKERTTQDLLAERRARIREMRYENDKVAGAMLQQHVNTIDVELDSRRPLVCKDCGELSTDVKRREFDDLCRRCDDWRLTDEDHRNKDRS